jgi:tellurite resistance protein TerC
LHFNRFPLLFTFAGMESNAFWIGFNIFILAMLAFDLGIVNKKHKVVSFRESILWVAFWSSLAFAFNGLVYYWFGPEKAFEYLTGYVIEWSLSVDNLFVFLVIFSYFDVPRQYQHRVLFWGIIGALILRGAFILVGVSLFQKFEWMIYIFGAILVFTGFKMLFQKDEEDHKMDDNFIVRFSKKLLPVTDKYHGHYFFVKAGAKWVATPLFIVLVVVDFTDLVFAVDSIPAVLSISSDPFIVYTSNVFAILGLRSLFFALSGMMDLFKYLKYGLAVILTFVGVKMLISHYVHSPVEWALFVVVMVLAMSILLSLSAKNRAK